MPQEPQHMNKYDATIKKIKIKKKLDRAPPCAGAFKTKRPRKLSLMEYCL